MDIPPIIVRRYMVVVVARQKRPGLQQRVKRPSRVKRRLGQRLHEKDVRRTTDMTMDMPIGMLAIATLGTVEEHVVAVVEAVAVEVEEGAAGAEEGAVEAASQSLLTFKSI